MRRFAIFVTVLLVLVVIGSRPGTTVRHRGSLSACKASRAAWIRRSIARMTAPTAPPRQHLARTAVAAQ